MGSENQVFLRYIYVPLIDVKPFVKFGIDTLQKKQTTWLCSIYPQSRQQKYNIQVPNRGLPICLSTKRHWTVLH